MAAIARVSQLCLCPAIGTKPVALVPVKQGTGLRQNGKFSLWQQTRYREAAQIHEIFFRRRGTRKPATAISVDAQQDPFGGICLPKRLQFSIGYNGPVTIHMDMPRRGLFQQAVEPLLISSVIGAAVEDISEKSERV